MYFWLVGCSALHSKFFLAKVTANPDERGRKINILSARESEAAQKIQRDVGVINIYCTRCILTLKSTLKHNAREPFYDHKEEFRKLSVQSKLGGLCDA